MSAFGMTARGEWLTGLARDYRDASLDAQADDEPADTYEPEDDDAATSWPPTAETGLHLVRPRSARGDVPGTCGDEDVAGAAGATGGRHDRLPVCGTCDGSGVLPSGAWYGGIREYVGCPECDRDQDPEPACLIHDTTGEDVRGWEMAECTCTKVARP